MSLRNKNVFITGAGGFVGSYLTLNLLKQGAKVFGLIQRRADGSLPRNLEDRGILDEIQLIEGDITDVTSTAFALDAAQPDIIFHLAAQSFIPRSFTHPLETSEVNCIGTANLLEAVRMNEVDPKIIFAGTSEEYGLVISSEGQYERAKEKYGEIFPPPTKIPELPVKEENPLRPMSPYAVSKVYGEYLMRNYHLSYGMKTLVSRGFNHEGAGRGIMFVTSVIANQVMKLKFKEVDKIVIGNVNAFRDWSHIQDIVQGYCLLSEKGKNGAVYNQGSQRTNSVLTYILLCLEGLGNQVNKIESVRGEKVVENPTERNHAMQFGCKFEKTRVDSLMLAGELEYTLADKGIYVYTDKGKILIEFSTERFRPSDVPILMANTGKIQKLGFEAKLALEDIIKDQLEYYMNEKNRV